MSIFGRLFESKEAKEKRKEAKRLADEAEIKRAAEESKAKPAVGQAEEKRHAGESEARSPSRSLQTPGENTLAESIATIVSLMSKRSTGQAGQAWEKELAEAMRAKVRCPSKECLAEFTIVDAWRFMKEPKGFTVLITCPGCGKKTSIKYG